MKNRLFFTGIVGIALILGLLVAGCDDAPDSSVVQYTVTFNSNGGTGSVPSQTVPANDNVTIPDGSGLSYSGYVFTHWNTKADGTGDSYYYTDVIKPTGNLTLYAQWAGAVNYYISFDANGGSGIVPAVISVAQGGSAVLPGGSNLSLSGHVFIGWNTTANGSGSSYTAGASFTPSENITLYAQWGDAASYYTVTFDANGGIGTVPDTIAIVQGDSVTVPGGSALSYSGYVFTGWDTAAGGSGTGYSTGDTFIPSNNITLYAQWDNAANYYTVTFDANGGSGTVSAIPVAQGGSVTIPGGSDLSYSGYVFDGWNTAANGSGTAYVAGDTFTPSGNITLYAQWDSAANYYTVTFDANGGSGVLPNAIAVTQGGNITIPGGSDLSRSGYEFAGWDTETDGSGTSYSADDTFTPTGNITLYAQWTASAVTPPPPSAEYTVTFNANGGSGTVPDAETVTAGSSITIPAGDTLSYSSNTFNGWYSADADDNRTYYDAGDTFTPDGDITLYAYWGVSYTVTFSYIWGSGTVPAAVQLRQGEGINLPDAPGLSLSGYFFNGWTTGYYGSGTHYDINEYYVPTENITLYADWGTLYTVTFLANGGSGTVPDSIEVKAGSSITLPDAPGLYRDGYVFTGWNTYYSSGTHYNVRDSYEPTGSTYLYAAWSQRYTVTYYANNGDGLVPASQTVAAGSSVYLQNGDSLSRTGYSFAGWNTYANGNGTTYAARAQFTPNQTTTDLYAQWTPIVYTVTFDSNYEDGGIHATTTGSITSSINLYNIGSPTTRAGYTFESWNTDPAGRGDRYTTTYGSTFTPTSNITLYAQWTKTSYTVTLDPNGGTGEYEPMVVSSGVSFNLMNVTSAFSREGYSLISWNTQATGRGISFNIGTTYTYASLSGDITLYAQWKSTAPIVISLQPNVVPVINSDELIIYRGAQTTVELTVANPEQYSSIKWYVTGTNESGDGPSFILDGANVAYNNSGNRLLVVEVVLLNGVPYSHTITFTVRD